MKERITYIANDGLEFDSKSACEAHEIDLQNSKSAKLFKSGALIIYNYDFEKVTGIMVPSAMDKSRSESVMETAKFIHIESQEAYGYIAQHCVDECLNYPDDLGNWVYDDDEGRWHEIGAYYREKAKEIDFCRFMGWFPKAE